MPQWKIPHDSTKILRATTKPNPATWVNKYLGIMTCVHLSYITLLAKTEINILPIDTHLATSGKAVSGERVNGLGNFWLLCRKHTWTQPRLSLLLVSLKQSKNLTALEHFRRRCQDSSDLPLICYNCLTNTEDKSSFELLTVIDFSKVFKLVFIWMKFILTQIELVHVIFN